MEHSDDVNKVGAKRRWHYDDGRNYSHESIVFAFLAGMGVWGKDGTLSALPHLSTVETVFHDSSRIHARVFCALIRH